MSMIDRFTRWVELAPVADIRAETVADALVCHLVLRHGCPQQLLSDRGSQFTSRLFRRVPQRLRIDIIFTTAYHPQTNGQVERFNSSIAACLSAFVKKINPIGTAIYKPSHSPTAPAWLTSFKTRPIISFMGEMLVCRPTSSGVLLATLTTTKNTASTLLDDSDALSNSRDLPKAQPMLNANSITTLVMNMFYSNPAP